ncbi:MAG: MATE family efflux transporter [Terrimicrobiaceae bacterium]
MTGIIAETRRTAALALPIAAGHVGQMLMGWADTMMIGHVGVTPLAACAFANTLLMVPLVFGFGLLSAVSVRTSIAYGSEDPAGCSAGLKGGWVMALLLGSIVAAVVALLAGFLDIFGQPPEVAAEAGPYLILCGISSIAVMISTSAKNFAEALARPWVPFFIVLGSVLLNILLNAALIYGLWGFPALGLTGAGWATLLARISGAAAMVSYPFLSRHLSSLARVAVDKDRISRELADQFRLGLPVGSMHLAEVTGFAVGSLMLGWIGINALAAHQIAITCAATTFMVPLGLSQAATVRVGQARGAGATDRCRLVAWGALGLATVLMACFGLIFWLAGTPIARLFNNDPPLIALTAQLLVVAALFQIFDGVQIVSSGILRGFEDVRTPMLIGMVAYWVIALPVSYSLGFLFHLGAVGVWIGFCVGLAFAAAALSSRVAHRLSARTSD